MNDEFDENVVSFFQRALPLLSSVFFILLKYLPINMVVFNNIRPDFGLVCIYFWIIHRPDLFNLFSIVFLGVLDFVLSSSFAGSCLFSYLVMYFLLYNTQKFFNAKPFVVVWYGYMALSLASILAKWLIASVYYSQFLPFSILIFSYLIGVSLYPLVSMVLAFLQNKLIQDDGL